MAVHDRPDPGQGLVDLAVDEALDIESAAPRLQGIAVDIELEDVVRRDQARRHAAREQKARRVRLVPHADMAEAVDHALVGQDPVGGDEIVDQTRMRCRPGLRYRCLRHLQCRRRPGEQERAEQRNRSSHALLPA